MISPSSATFYEKFRVLDVQLFAVSAEPVAVKLATAERLGLPFPVLADAIFTVGRALGLEQAGVPAGKSKKITRPACTLIVDPNQRILERIAPMGKGMHAVSALVACDKWTAARGSSVVTVQAPVLMVPNVIDQKHCLRLIGFWETGDRYESGVPLPRSVHSSASIQRPQHARVASICGKNTAVLDFYRNLVAAHLTHCPLFRLYRFVIPEFSVSWGTLRARRTSAVWGSSGADRTTLVSEGAVRQ